MDFATVNFRFNRTVLRCSVYAKGYSVFVYLPLCPKRFIAGAALCNLRYFFTGEVRFLIPTGKRVVCFGCIL